MDFAVKYILTRVVHFLHKYNHQYNSYYRYAWPDDDGEDRLFTSSGCRCWCWNQTFTMISYKLWFNILLSKASPYFQGDIFTFDSALHRYWGVLKMRSFFAAVRSMSSLSVVPGVSEPPACLCMALTSGLSHFVARGKSNTSEKVTNTDVSKPNILSYCCWKRGLSGKLIQELDMVGGHTDRIEIT
jgi:hypothetical protein